MPRSNRASLMVMLALAAGFLIGLWRLYDLRFTTGDIYPAYSSLRADPLGSMAFYESIGQLPALNVVRNFLPISSMPKEQATVFFLGVDPLTFRTATEDRIREFETLAKNGARVVIVMEPVRRPDAPRREAAPTKDDAPKKEDAPKKDNSPKKDDATPPKSSTDPTAMELRWGVIFDYVTRPDSEQPEEIFSRPKLTALYFRYKEKRASKVEIPFGAGAIVLLANSYPMSNEALVSDRDPKLLADALGTNRKIVFDEHHLGLSEEGGVVTLARKYHLQGLAIALLGVLALFIWKNSSSFLPPRNDKANEESIVAKDVGSGLANLLRRNVSNKSLLATCLEQWEKSNYGGRHYAQSRIARARAALERGADPVEIYREVARILAERSN